MATSGKTVFTIFIVVAGLGWGAGAVGLQVERAEQRRLEAAYQAQLLAADEARRAAEAKRISEHNASWMLPMEDKDKNWQLIQDASGENLFQYRYVSGNCPSSYDCTLLEVNPKYSCRTATFFIEWLDSKHALVKTTTHMRDDLTATQTFRWTLVAGPAKGIQFANVVSATCDGKTF